MLGWVLDDLKHWSAGVLSYAFVHVLWHLSRLARRWCKEHL